MFRIASAATASFFAHDMPTYAAALAYRLLLALFPFLVFLISLLAYLGVPDFFEWMRDQAAQLMPRDAMQLVDTILDEIQIPRAGVLSGAVAIALWSASSAMLGTMNGLNVAYEVAERRPAWRRMLLAIVFTLAFAVILVLVAVIMVTGPSVLRWLTAYVQIDAYFMAAWPWLRWPILFGLLVAMVALVYYVAPNRKQPLRVLGPGALVAVCTWIVASIGFALYIQNFGRYSQTYGSIGAVIVLLLYFFLSAAVMLFGAEINAILERSKLAAAQERK